MPECSPFLTFSCHWLSVTMPMEFRFIRYRQINTEIVETTEKNGAEEKRKEG